MVTIDSSKSIQPNTTAAASRNHLKTKNDGFDAILKQEMATKTAAPVKPESPTPIENVRPAWCADESQLSGSMAVDRVGKLIDTMATYQSKLIEHGATLKDLHGLVQQMTSQSKSLASLTDKMEESDDLKAIVNQSLMLSSMEISRYYDGYYVD
jgi:hypothetical protein